MSWGAEFLKLLQEAEKRKAEVREAERQRALLESIKQAARGKRPKQGPGQPLLAPPYKRRPKSKGSKGIPATRRQKVFERDRYICQVCGWRFPEQHLVPNHIDHNIRHSRMSNLETTCAGCNMQEGMIYAKLLREAGPRDSISEEKRLQIVGEARRIAREQAPRRGWRSSSMEK